MTAITKTKCVVYANPFYDRMIEVSEHFLEGTQLERAQSNATDQIERVNALWKSATAMEGKRSKGLGGAATNVARVLSQLGHSITVYGVRGCDKRGEKIEDLARKSRINPHYIIGKEPQGCIDCFIDPSKQRTMHAYFGASNEFIKEHVLMEQMNGAQLVFIEGYMYFVEGVPEVAIAYAKEQQATTAIGLPTSNVVKLFSKRMMSSLSEVDFIFGNEEEILALTESTTIEEALGQFKLNQTIIVTNGPQECVVKPAGTTDSYLCPVPEIKEIVNPTGAGDVFSAVVLSGVLKKIDLRQAVEKAIRVAQYHIRQWSLPQTPEEWKHFVQIAE